jgi:hypothetical protein
MFRFSKKGIYGNFRYLQKHVNSKKIIFENFGGCRGFGNPNTAG